MARKSLKDVKFSDGKDEKFVPTTLDQIWGESDAKYSTDNLEEYESLLQSFSKADLQAHSIKVGLLPSESRERTVKRLLSSFREHKAANKPLPAPIREKTPSKDVSAILREGR